jgi:hypothetical protein
MKKNTSFLYLSLDFQHFLWLIVVVVVMVKEKKFSFLQEIISKVEKVITKHSNEKTGKMKITEVKARLILI